MSDASGPQRIQVAGTKRKGDEHRTLSHKGTDRTDDGHDVATAPGQSADGGQPTKESGGTRRGDENDDSGGAGRAPREEGAVSSRVGATTATAAGRRVSNHSSRASDGSRPPDDTDRRPEVPGDVGPMINAQRGEESRD